MRKEKIAKQEEYLFEKATLTWGCRLSPAVSGILHPENNKSVETYNICSTDSHFKALLSRDYLYIDSPS